MGLTSLPLLLRIPTRVDWARTIIILSILARKFGVFDGIFKVVSIRRAFLIAKFNSVVIHDTEFGLYWIEGITIIIQPSQEGTDWVVSPVQADPL